MITPNTNVVIKTALKAMKNPLLRAGLSHAIPSLSIIFSLKALFSVVQIVFKSSTVVPT